MDETTYQVLVKIFNETLGERSVKIVEKPEESTIKKKRF